MSKDSLEGRPARRIGDWRRKMKMSRNIKLAILASLAVLSTPAMAWKSANDGGRLRYFTNTIDLNMRAWPAPVSQIVATLPRGSQLSADRCVHPEGLQDDWCHVMSTHRRGGPMQLICTRPGGVKPMSTTCRPPFPMVCSTCGLGRASTML